MSTLPIRQHMNVKRREEFQPSRRLSLIRANAASGAPRRLDRRELRPSVMRTISDENLVGVIMLGVQTNLPTSLAMLARVAEQA